MEAALAKGSKMEALILYFLAIFRDGDSGNDWIMHLPHMLRPLIMHCGDALSLLLILLGLA